MGKVSAWPGITSNGQETGATGKVPLWTGAPRVVKFTAAGVWAAVAATVFLLANQRMPEDDGFGGFIPLYFALAVFIAGMALTERNALRVANTMPDHAGENDFQ